MNEHETVQRTIKAEYDCISAGCTIDCSHCPARSSCSSKFGLSIINHPDYYKAKKAWFDNWLKNNPQPQNQPSTFNDFMSKQPPIELVKKVSEYLEKKHTFSLVSLDCNQDMPIELAEQAEWEYANAREEFGDELVTLWEQGKIRFIKDDQP